MADEADYAERMTLYRRAEEPVRRFFAEHFGRLCSVCGAVAAATGEHFCCCIGVPCIRHLRESPVLSAMVEAIRKMERALGSGSKEVQSEEMELREYAQRSIQAIKDIKKGEILKEGENIDILRPGKQNQGLHPKHLPEIEGKTAARDISLGDGITEDLYGY